MVAVVVLFAFIAILVAVPVTAILGTVDALQQPAQAWTASGYRRRTWVWQALGVFMMPVALGYSGCYFLRVRPRLVAAARPAIGPTPPTAWPAPGLAAVADRAVAEESVRIRASWLVGLMQIGPAVVVILMNVALNPGHAWPIGLVVVWLCVIGVSAATWAYYGVTLTATEAIVHNLRRRRVAWSDVRAVTAEPLFGSRRVVLWTDHGRVPLRTPTMPLPGVGRRRFERDFHTIGRWWEAHR